jgi:hypothetical protein
MAMCKKPTVATTLSGGSNSQEIHEEEIEGKE